MNFAFFGKDAPERKANKAVEDKSESFVLRAVEDYYQWLAMYP